MELTLKNVSCTALLSLLVGVLVTIFMVIVTALVTLVTSGNEIVWSTSLYPPNTFGGAFLGAYLVLWFSNPSKLVVKWANQYTNRSPESSTTP